MRSPLSLSRRARFMLRCATLGARFVLMPAGGVPADLHQRAHDAPGARPIVAAAAPERSSVTAAWRASRPASLAGAAPST